MSDVWQVKLASGEVRSLDVDQLDAAFQAGWVSPSTPVLALGAAQWTTLAEAAGLDDVEAAPYSIAPIALDAARAELDLEIDFASATEMAAYRRPRRRWGLFVGVVALLAFVPAAGFGGMKIAERTLGAAPPSAVAPPPVVASPTPAAPAPAKAVEEAKPKATTVFGVSVTDLPNAKKITPAAFKQRRHK